MKSLLKASALTAALFMALGSMTLFAVPDGVELCKGSGEHCATVKKGIITVKFVKAEGTPDVHL